MVQEEAIYMSHAAQKSLHRINYADTFATTNHLNTLEEITLMAFGKTPKWIKVLFDIRNLFAKLIGLKTDASHKKNAVFEVGGFVGFAEIYLITDNEIIVGANDSHLNFRASICNTDASVNNIKLTSLVEYNNTTGKVYFFFVKPFHKLVTKSMLKQSNKNK